LWPPHELAESEKGRVITAVTSIVGHTRTQQRGDIPGMQMLAAAVVNKVGETLGGKPSSFQGRQDLSGLVRDWGKSFLITSYLLMFGPRSGWGRRGFNR